MYSDRDDGLGTTVIALVLLSVSVFSCDHCAWLSVIWPPCCQGGLMGSGRTASSSDMLCIFLPVFFKVYSTSVVSGCIVLAVMLKFKFFPCHCTEGIGAQSSVRIWVVLKLLGVRIFPSTMSRGVTLKL